MDTGVFRPAQRVNIAKGGKHGKIKWRKEAVGIYRLFAGRNRCGIYRKFSQGYGAEGTGATDVRTN
ncbi:hypothetical protein A5N82_01835 [Christensenella minuta]|uniref:Uncharacterized protein n=1 Tax=Christensenella minuta TaxID=626937 RepID=A0A136Q2B8_9FIRM|nr:hypothetical protein B1H56_04915 [Christensenella minuta]KXK64828.1 hypothetical protein HMPREF3293_02069 [Christensenella minuta]OAQ43134.1 hypothetical protein A5N82_01835 [Christensenella minuta]